MSYVTGPITLGAPGTKSVNIGFRPTWVRFTVGGKGGDLQSHSSIGATDGTNQWCASTYADTSGSASFNSSSKVVSQWERTSGIVEVLAASWTSFTASGFTLNVTIANTTYNVNIEAGT